MSFGARLRQFREQQGLRLSDLAQRTGFSEGFLADLEADRLPMPMIEVHKILAHALATTPRMLLGTYAESVPYAHIYKRIPGPPTPTDLEQLCRVMADIVAEKLGEEGS